MSGASTAYLYELSAVALATDTYPEPSAGSGIAATLIVPAVLLLLIAGVLVLARRLQRGALARDGGDGSLKLRDALALGAQQRLLSVEWDGTRLLLAQTADSIELLTSDLVRARVSELSGRAGSEGRHDETPRPDDSPSFADMLRDDPSRDGEPRREQAGAPGMAVGTDDAAEGTDDAAEGTDDAAEGTDDVEVWHV